MASSIQIQSKLWHFDGLLAMFWVKVTLRGFGKLSAEIDKVFLSGSRNFIIPLAIGGVLGGSPKSSRSDFSLGLMGECERAFSKGGFEGVVPCLALGLREGKGLEAVFDSIAEMTFGSNLITIFSPNPLCLYFIFL